MENNMEEIKEGESGGRKETDKGLEQKESKRKKLLKRSVAERNGWTPNCLLPPIYLTLSHVTLSYSVSTTILPFLLPSYSSSYYI